MTRIVSFITICLVLLISEVAYSGSVVVNSQCPGITVKNSWKSYMLGRYNTPGLVGVVFNKARKYKDPEAIGNLRTDVCYVVRYSHEGPSDYYGKGYFSYHHTKGAKGPPRIKKNLPGNPGEYEINVYGVVLLFNEGGQILDRKGRIVGKMMCRLVTHQTCDNAIKN